MSNPYVLNKEKGICVLVGCAHFIVGDARECMGIILECICIYLIRIVMDRVSLHELRSRSYHRHLNIKSILGMSNLGSPRNATAKLSEKATHQERLNSINVLFNLIKDFSFCQSRWNTKRKNVIYFWLFTRMTPFVITKTKWFNSV